MRNQVTEGLQHELHINFYFSDYNLSFSHCLVLTITTLKGLLSSVFRPQMPSKCMVIALILIYDISSALLEPKIAMKVTLDPKYVKFSQYEHTYSAPLSKNRVTVN